MLVIISDLHLNDDSAAPENIAPAAFGIWLDEVLGLALDNEAKELVFLFLGDIIDLLRTEYWFYPAAAPNAVLKPVHEGESFPLQHRPWGLSNINDLGGKPTELCLERARQIQGEVSRLCVDQLALLRGDLNALSTEYKAENPEQIERITHALELLSDRNVPIRRIFIPGNHDRLFLHDPKLARAMLAALGAATIPPGTKGGLHAYQDATYGVVARHGHEWDLWNYEAYRKNQQVQMLTDESFKLVPIGDPITTELLARLPYEMLAELQADAHGHAVASEVYTRLKQIEDVRPLDAALKWMLVEGQRFAGQYGSPVREAVQSALVRVVKRVMAGFMEIPFVHGWLDLHDRFNLKLDEADTLQDLDRAVRYLSFDALDTILSVAHKLDEWGVIGKDECARGAGEERLLTDARDSDGIRYCVYGHTHTFKHEPLGCRADGSERVYMNSGTWRPRVAQTRDQGGFVGFKEMTWLAFYGPDEDPVAPGVHKGTSYETWTGLMLKRKR